MFFTINYWEIVKNTYILQNNCQNMFCFIYTVFNGGFGICTIFFNSVYWLWVTSIQPWHIWFFFFSFFIHDFTYFSMISVLLSTISPRSCSSRVLEVYFSYFLSFSLRFFQAFRLCVGKPWQRHFFFQRFLFFCMF